MPWRSGCRTSSGPRSPTRSCWTLAAQGRIEPARGAAGARWSGCSTIARAHRFTENFVGQWLDLRKINATIPDPQLYGDFDGVLLWAMPRETHVVLRGGAAQRPEPAGVRRFRLDDAQRTAGDALRHPRRQGERIPQGDAAAGQPSRRRDDAGERAQGDGRRHAHLARAARQMGARADHRQAACPAAAGRAGHRARHPRRHHDPPAARQASQHRCLCARATTTSTRPASHSRTFDPIGGWREFYRASARTKAGIVQLPGYSGRPIYRGPDVEKGGVTPDGRTFNDIDEYKKLLLADKDQLARSLTEKLLVYATGADIQFADREVVEQIVAMLQSQQLRLPDPGPRGGPEPGILEQVTHGLRRASRGHPCRHRPLDRRTFLRSSGVAIALPLSRRDAAGDRRRGQESRGAAEADGADRPAARHVRALLLSRAGRPRLRAEPLSEAAAPHRDHFTVFSGMSHHYAAGHFAEVGPDDGRPHREHSLERYPQLDLARPGSRLAHRRPDPVRVAGPRRRQRRLEPARRPHSRRSSGRPRSSSSSSFAARRQEEARELRRLRDGQSILDDVRGQVESINGKLSDADRQRLDLYLSSVREAEQRLQQDELWSKTPKPKVPVPPPTSDFGDAQLLQRSRQWYDIVHLALQTDSTRVDLALARLAGTARDRRRDARPSRRFAPRPGTLQAGATGPDRRGRAARLRRVPRQR